MRLTAVRKVIFEWRNDYKLGISDEQVIALAERLIRVWRKSSRVDKRVDEYVKRNTEVR